MKVGNRVFAGKGAREESGKALNEAVLSWRDDQTLKVRGHYRGFEILSRGGVFQDSDPEILIRGMATYKANFNPDSPQGTIASVDAALRSLDRKAEADQQDIDRQVKALADYKAQLGRPFEHEARLKELLVKQAELNAQLDLDKHEAQTVAEPREVEAKVLASSNAYRLKIVPRQWLTKILRLC